MFQGIEALASQNANDQCFDCLDLSDEPPGHRRLRFSFFLPRCQRAVEPRFQAFPNSRLFLPVPQRGTGDNEPIASGSDEEFDSARKRPFLNGLGYMATAGGVSSGLS